jgi:hypothetical protein
MTLQWKAEGLAALGLYVFPCRPDNRRPFTRHGFLEASIDLDEIAAWWEYWPDAHVGVATGASGIVVGDFDAKPDKNGFDSLRAAALPLPKCFAYRSTSGKGMHAVYACPEGLEIGPTQDHETPEGVKLIGLDRRSGGSYVVWAGDVPESRDLFTAPPLWLLTPTGESNSHSGMYQGDVMEWLNENTPDGEEDDKFATMLVQAVVGVDFNRDRMLRIQIKLMSIAKRGGVVRQALMSLYNEWLRDGWDTYDNRRDFLVGLRGAIPKVFTPKQEFVPAASTPAVEMTDGAEDELQHEPEETEDEGPPAYVARFEEASVYPAIPLDVPALEQALRTYCERLAPSLDLDDQQSIVTQKLLLCLRLLPQISTEEKAQLWLAKTKKAMYQTIGASS